MFTVLVTADLHSTPEQIVARYAAHWPMEQSWEPTLPLDHGDVSLLLAAGRPSWPEAVTAD